MVCDIYRVVAMDAKRDNNMSDTIVAIDDKMGHNMSDRGVACNSY